MKRTFNRMLAFALMCGATSAWAAEAAEGGEHSGGGGIMDMLGLQPKAIVVQICGFIILFLLLKKFLFGPLQNALHNRTSEIQSVYDRIAEQERNLEVRRTELEARLSGVEAEARDRIQQAVNDAKAIQEQMLTEARTQADRTLDQGRKMLQMEQQQAFASLREEMAGLAVRAAGQIIGENMDNERNNRMVRDFIQQVES